eukprot:m.89689 g.89689  ORF g.89689 m.89689 type:complete len:58 (-) comp13235_c0_seq1:1481-1654(-)
MNLWTLTLLFRGWCNLGVHQQEGWLSCSAKSNLHLNDLKEIEFSNAHEIAKTESSSH